MTERHSHPQQALLRQQGWAGVHLGRGVQAGPAPRTRDCPSWSGGAALTKPQRLGSLNKDTYFSEFWRLDVQI